MAVVSWVMCRCVSEIVVDVSRLDKAVWRIGEGSVGACICLEEERLLNSLLKWHYTISTSLSVHMITAGSIPSLWPSPVCTSSPPIIPNPICTCTTHISMTHHHPYLSLFCVPGGSWGISWKCWLALNLSMAK